MRPTLDFSIKSRTGTSGVTSLTMAVELVIGGHLTGGGGTLHDMT